MPYSEGVNQNIQVGYMRACGRMGQWHKSTIKRENKTKTLGTTELNQTKRTEMDEHQREKKTRKRQCGSE